MGLCSKKLSKRLCFRSQLIETVIGSRHSLLGAGQSKTTAVMAPGNYSDPGRDARLENAWIPVLNGSICIGITSSNGAVIAAYKEAPSKLVDLKTVRHVQIIADHVGMVYSGIGPDFYVLLAAARNIAQKHYCKHDAPIPILELTTRLANIMKVYSNASHFRPFGVSLLVCGWDDGSLRLYQVHASGVYSAWKATALGKNLIQANKTLVERYSQVKNLNDAIYTVFQAMVDAGYEMLTDYIDIGTCDEKGFRHMDLDSVKDYLYNFVFNR